VGNAVLGEITHGDKNPSLRNIEKVGLAALCRKEERGGFPEHIEPTNKTPPAIQSFHI
jgi:hypothetical protein